MKYKAVFFDIDGTLYPEAEVRELLSGFVKRHPLINLRYGKLRRRFREIQDTDSKVFSSGYSFREKEAFALLGENCPVEKVKKYAGKLETDYYSNLRKAYEKLAPETLPVRTLEYLKKNGIITGVLSDWPLFDKLTRLGLKQYFDFEISAEETGYLKPSVRCFEYMLKKINCKASDVLYVGDSYAKDVAGASAAGIDAVLINCRNPAKGRYEKAKAVFRDFTEFEKWILNL